MWVKQFIEFIYAVHNCLSSPAYFTISKERKILNGGKERETININQKTLTELIGLCATYHNLSTPPSPMEKKVKVKNKKQPLPNTKMLYQMGQF